MFGWINDCTESLITTKFGLETWHLIKQKANCTTPDRGFVRHEYYPDSSTVDLVVAASQVLNLTVEQVLEAFGQYFMEFTRKNGYEKLLNCQGSTLRLWLSNLNALHDHLESSLPRGFVAPVFWCEDCDEHEGSILLHYYSRRGSLLVPVVVGVVKEVAIYHFDVEIEMERLAMQGDENGAEFTTFRISAVDDMLQWKLTYEDEGEWLRRGEVPKEERSLVNGGRMKMKRPSLHRKNTMRRRNWEDGDGGDGDGSDSDEDEDEEKGLKFVVDNDEDVIDVPMRCPFSGVIISSKNIPGMVPEVDEEDDEEEEEMEKREKRSEEFNKEEERPEESSKSVVGSALTKMMSLCPIQSCKKKKKKKQGTTPSIMPLPEPITTTTPNTTPSPTKSTSSRFVWEPAEEKQEEVQEEVLIEEEEEEEEDEIASGLSPQQMQSIFPYHVMVDHEFSILQVGKGLPPLVPMYKNQSPNHPITDPEAYVGKHIKEILTITRPVLGSWNWSTLQKLADQTFFLTPAPTIFKTGGGGVSSNDPPPSPSQQQQPSPPCSSSSSGSTGNSGNVHVQVTNPAIKFKGNMLQFNNDQVHHHCPHRQRRNKKENDNTPNKNTTTMFILSPDAKNVSELTAMKLTMSSLPLHSFQRDSVFLGEHIASEVRSAHNLEKLSKKLENEKNLSNTLLYSMLPRSVADELRSGRTVEPAHHEKVTLFFSDVVGFTSICDAIEPWDVIDMLNQLYSIMDHLVMKFNLYKVETIGDAYMCCSGLPVPDERHAENVADFAIAVLRCVRHVKNPVADRPLQLRIGIHTGHCMGGVVGTLTPHYCLFGDMVNTTARHESTGVAGKIQCSSVLYGRLQHFGVSEEDLYDFKPRGLVEMKGKGERFTYWLEGGTDDNQRVNPKALDELYDQVGAMLAKKKWKKRRYFRRGSIFGEGSVTGSDGLTMIDSVPSVYSADDDDEDGAPKRRDDGSTIATSDAMDNDDKDNDTGSMVAGRSIIGSNDDADADRDKNLEDSFHFLDTAKFHDDMDIVDAAPTTTSTTTFDESTSSLVCSSFLLDPLASEGEDNAKNWSTIGWDPTLSREDLVAKVHQLMSTLLSRCITFSPPSSPQQQQQQQQQDAMERMELLDSQLYGFVRKISLMYNDDNGFHNWKHACHVILGATYLAERAQIQNTTTNNNSSSVIYENDESLSSFQHHHQHQHFVPAPPNPWTVFASSFAALIHDAKHLGVTNRQLELEDNVLCQVYDGGSSQERQSLQVGLCCFAEEFPELAREVLKGCPTFLRLVTSSVLVTDIASRERQKMSKDKFERVLNLCYRPILDHSSSIDDNNNNNNMYGEDERTEAALEQMLLLADVGHCSQRYETFLHWNRAFYEECYNNFLDHRGDDPRSGWFQGQIGFLQNYVLPLAERCQQLMPKNIKKCDFAGGVGRILDRWKSHGKDWTDSMIKDVERRHSLSSHDDHAGELIDDDDDHAAKTDVHSKPQILTSSSTPTTLAESVDDDDDDDSGDTDHNHTQLQQQGQQQQQQQQQHHHDFSAVPPPPIITSRGEQMS